MISSAYSVPQNLVSWTGVTPGDQKCLEGTKTDLGCAKRFEFIRIVMGTYIANDTMLWRSDQLLLTTENDHFEGSMHMEVKENCRFRWIFYRKIQPYIHICVVSL